MRHRVELSQKQKERMFIVFGMLATLFERVDLLLYDGTEGADRSDSALRRNGAVDVNLRGNP